MPDTLFILLQHCLPKQALTEFGALIANAKAGRATTKLIRWFIKKYQVNMQEALNPDPASYASFNEFFTRPLNPAARPLGESDFVCPVDGAVSQLGKIDQDQIFQAKGHSFSTAALLGGDATLAEKFQDGNFINIYLSPRDYHRIHMPCDGRLVGMTYIPGKLFSVNPVTAQGVANLFARNERVVCQFDSSHGPFVMVLVGATIVGSMTTIWHGTVNPPRGGRVLHWEYENQSQDFSKGDEMGRFELGSTVLILFPANLINFNASLQAADAVKLGAELGNLLQR